MLEKNYKFLLWIYIFWFLGSVLLVSLHIIPPELTAVQSLFLVFTGVLRLFSLSCSMESGSVQQLRYLFLL